MSTSDETPETASTDAGTDGSGNDRPLLRVVRGEPDDTELAALTAVVAGLAAGDGGKGGEGGDAPPRSRWADRAALVHAPPAPGPGAWRASALRR